MDVPNLSQLWLDERPWCLGWSWLLRTKSDWADWEWERDGEWDWEFDEEWVSLWVRVWQSYIILGLRLH